VKQSPALLGLLASVACSPNPEQFAVVRNFCARDSDCVQMGTAAEESAICNAVTTRCEHPRAREPYPLILQVSLDSDLGSRVPRYSRETELLTTRVDDAVLSVPNAVTVTGAIRQTAGRSLVQAAVTFTPITSTAGYPVLPVTEYTSPLDDGTENNLRTLLDPGLAYDVRIQPLKGDSENLPPKTLSGLRFDDSDTPRFDFTYPEVTELALRIVDGQGNPQKDAYVRLVDRATKAVISSTNRSHEDGLVVLRAEDDHLTAGFEILLGFAMGNPWLEQLRADPARLEPGLDGGAPVLAVPTLPDKVTYEGRLGMPADLQGQSVDPAELVFVSTFPAPSGSGNTAERFWCRSNRVADPLPPFVCSAEISAVTDKSGQFSVQLLPGEYRVYARPSGGVDDATAVRTVLLEDVIVQRPTPDNPLQSGQLIQLEKAVGYTGLVVTPDRRFSPNVAVRADALDVHLAADEVGSVAHYARSIETITDLRGRFSIRIDEGYYDLSLRPSADTGFAWSHVPNRAVLARSGAYLGELALQSPVVYAGKVVGADSIPINSATVDAYAVVQSLEGTPRAVRVATTQVDTDGQFELLLPPKMEGALDLNSAGNGDASVATRGTPR
jgi:hypothetical protein